MPVQGIRTLTLAVHDVALGRFEAIETFCVDHALVFARWAGGAPGAFGPERVVFDGTTVRRFSASDDDEILISAETVRGLGSYAAVLSHLAAAELEVPRSESTAEAEGKAKPVGVDTSPPEDAAYASAEAVHVITSRPPPAFPKSPMRAGTFGRDPQQGGGYWVIDAVSTRAMAASAIIRASAAKAIV